MDEEDEVELGPTGKTDTLLHSAAHGGSNGATHALVLLERQERRQERQRGGAEYTPPFYESEKLEAFRNLHRFLADASQAAKEAQIILQDSRQTIQLVQQCMASNAILVTENTKMLLNQSY